MHFVIDAHLAVKKIDGVARYLMGLLSELPQIDRSIQYSILTLPLEHSSLPEDIFKQPNVNRVRFNLIGPSPIQHLKMRSLLKDLKADLYHHPQYDLPFGVQVPSVVTIHDLKYLFHAEFLKKGSLLKSLYIKKSLQHTIKAADQIIVASQNTLSDLIKLFSFEQDKVTIIYHGVNPASKSSSNHNHDFFDIPNEFILFVGTRRPHKNIEGLIKALAILRNNHKLNVDLVISGKAYSEYSKPEKVVKELGIETHTHFLDFVSETELTSLYQAAKLVALPSFYEGFGFPLLEAMSYGKPVIGSNLSSMPEVIGNAGLLVDPYNPNDIAKKIHEIITDSNLYQKLSEAGLERCKQFSWSSVAKATFNVYIKALKIKKIS
ncbi:MAG: glycosyltransferase family 4 protein [bacterium]